MRTRRTLWAIVLASAVIIGLMTTTEAAQATASINKTAVCVAMSINIPPGNATTAEAAMVAGAAARYADVLHKKQANLNSSAMLRAENTGCLGTVTPTLAKRSASTTSNRTPGENSARSRAHNTAAGTSRGAPAVSQNKQIG